MKNLLFSIFLFTILLFPSQVSAEISNATDSLKFRQPKATNQETIQDKIASRSALMDQKREQFKIRLQEIKDLQKQKILENLDKSYVNINKRWTTHFLNVLERLSKIADKINAPPDLKDKISTLKTTVTTQASKTYTITITDEAKLGESAKAVHDQLRTDLESLRSQIQDIRESLRKIIVNLPTDT